MKRVFASLVSLWAVLLLPAMSHAQSDNFPAVEGYVFDKKTLKPLANAAVTMTTVEDGPATLLLSVLTDANGFYSMIVTVPWTGTSRSLTAECTTRRGIGSSTMSLYSTLQQTVYRRDLYVALPRNMTACRAP